ncbi:unnamed protein product [Prunus armeniaca]|uniref:Uncharacterized protein n=1 Tax=Prunus armeniaca TaxID=36596 RepID=A0A6J5W861_PRUAR|nr:unnamed protein product [Prunus armeniaca]
MWDSEIVNLGIESNIVSWGLSEVLMGLSFSLITYAHCLEARAQVNVSTVPGTCFSTASILPILNAISKYGCATFSYISHQLMGTNLLTPEELPRSLTGFVEILLSAPIKMDNVLRPKLEQIVLWPLRCRQTNHTGPRIEEPPYRTYRDTDDEVFNALEWLTARSAIKPNFTSGDSMRWGLGGGESKDSCGVWVPQCTAALACRERHEWDGCGFTGFVVLQVLLGADMYDVFIIYTYCSLWPWVSPQQANP